MVPFCPSIFVFVAEGARVCFFNKKRGILRFFFLVVLAAWPSGKARDSKSIFPSSNPSVALIDKRIELIYSVLLIENLHFFTVEAKGERIKKKNS